GRAQPSDGRATGGGGRGARAGREAGGVVEIVDYLGVPPRRRLAGRRLGHRRATRAADARARRPRRARPPRGRTPARAGPRRAGLLDRARRCPVQLRAGRRRGTPGGRAPHPVRPGWRSAVPHGRRRGLGVPPRLAGGRRERPRPERALHDARMGDDMPRDRLPARRGASRRRPRARPPVREPDPRVPLGRLAARSTTARARPGYNPVMRRLTVLGSCGAWPEAGRACSGFLVEYDGFRLVLDLGYATLPRLLARCPGGEVDAV